MGTHVSRNAGYGGTWGRGVETGRQKTLVKVTVQSPPGETGQWGRGTVTWAKKCRDSGEGLASLGREIIAVQKGPQRQA